MVVICFTLAEEPLIPVAISFIFLVSASFSQDKGIESFENEKYDDARSFYENILRKRKNDDSAKFGLGVSAYKQNDITTAINSLKCL